MAHDDGRSTPPTLPFDEHDDVFTGDAVQGELFATGPDEHVSRGYRGTIASKVAGITYRQLDYWARKQIVEPSITPSHGSGSRRLYSFKDVVVLAVSKRLLDAGVNLQNVTTAIGFLMQYDTEELERVTIMSDGNEVHQCIDPQQIVDYVKSGRAMFSVSVDALWRRVHDNLEHEDYVDLTATGSATVPGRPIDELTEARLRLKLDAQRASRRHA
ncbi:MerR family transcriptional regulator [Bifidobacterium mongoliense]|uniref:MerR family transcriptional regulator n=1 Tax=Bifidobacterium mongoliense TaxID=518643 RepID=UPI0030EF2E91